MKKDFFVSTFCFLALVTSRNVASQTADSTLDVVAYPFAEIPIALEGGSETLADKEIKRLSESLPTQLETEIQSIVPRKKVSFVEMEDIPKLQKVLLQTKANFKFKDVQNVVKTISEKFAKVDAVLFMKIEKVGLASIKITAKIVDVSSRKISQKQEKVNLDTDGLLDAKVKILAKNLAGDIVSRGSLIRNPKVWAVAATIASAVWWVVENNHVRNDDKNYGDATTTVEATRAGIEAEKSVTRRNIAAGSTAVAAGALLIFSIF